MEQETSNTDLNDAAEKRREAIRVLMFLLPTVLFGGVIGAITGLKTSFLLKEQMGLNASDLGTLNLLLGLPSYLQPFIGMWTDMFAFLGYHRRSYYLSGKVLHAAGLAGLALLESAGRIGDAHHHNQLTVFALLLIIGAGGIIRTVIFNAILVALGNFTGRFGQFLAIVNLTPIVLSIVYTANLSGYVADHWSYQHAFWVGTILTILSTPLVFLIDEKRSSNRRHAAETHEEHAARMAKKVDDRRRILASIVHVAKTPGVWALTAFVFYLIVTPGVNNAKLYFEQDSLQFSRELIGQLARFASIGALIGYAVYGLVSRRIPIYMLAWGAWLMDCASYPTLLLLHSPGSAKVLEVGTAVIGALYAVCLNTLAARMCPKGLEGAVYGLIQAAIAISGNLSEKIGGWLYVRFGPENPGAHYTIQHGWNWSLYAGLAFTVVGVVFIPFLPAWTHSKKRVGDLTDEDVIDMAG